MQYVDLGQRTYVHLRVFNDLVDRSLIYSNFSPLFPSSSHRPLFSSHFSHQVNRFSPSSPPSFRSVSLDYGGLVRRDSPPPTSPLHLSHSFRERRVANEPGIASWSLPSAMSSRKSETHLAYLCFLFMQTCKHSCFSQSQFFVRLTSHGVIYCAVDKNCFSVEVQTCHLFFIYIYHLFTASIMDTM